VSGIREVSSGFFSKTAFLAAGVALAGTLVFAASALAANAAHHGHLPPRLSVTTKPAAADEGSTVTVSGKVKGKLASPVHRYRISVQSHQGSGFATLSSAHMTASHSFSLHFTAPAKPGSVTLRVRLRLGSKELARTKTWKLVVRKHALQGVNGAPPAPARKTVVLAPSTVTSAPPPGEAGTLRLTGVSDLNPGDVIAIGIGSNTPDGFLGRVVSVSQDGSELVVQTVPAELPEALPEGEFEQEFDAEEFDTADPSASAVRTAHASSHSSGPVVQNVNLAIKCAASAKVQVSGNVAVSPQIEISGGWGPFSGVHAKFVGSVSASSELAASADAAASCNVGPVTLFKRTLQPIEFSVGPVPVVVIPVLSATLSADGNVEASVETEVHGSIAAKAGIEYSHGDVHPVSGFEKNFGWTPPEPSGNAHLEAKVSPTIDLLVYGVGGPSATFNAGLAVDANTSQTPAWTLTAPISLTAKLSIPVLGISSGTLTVYQHSFLLAEAGEPSIQGQIHFDELPEGTVVTDQYANVGVVFDSPVFITSDGANPTSPVLSGEPTFEGPVVGHFVIPGTNTPTTVNLLQLDAGYIDNPGSVEIVAHLSNGQTRTAVADHLGIDQISMATRGIQSFTVQAVSAEEAGFAIDNLGFSR
jgi:hypothetical protein